VIKVGDHVSRIALFVLFALVITIIERCLLADWQTFFSLSSLLSFICFV
jgi:hypothetical protein